MIDKLAVQNNQGEKIQKFLRLKSHWADKHECHTDEILFDHRLSTVLTCAHNSQVIKLIKPRTWHEEVKLLWNKSRVHVEYEGSKILEESGIIVPKIYEIGIRYPWQLKSKYIGYCLMENLYSIGAEPVSKIIESCKFDNKISDVIKNILLQDLIKMKKNRVIYSDLHFKNIFINNHYSRLIFIDTGAIRIKSKAKFENLFEKTLKKFCKNSAHQLFSDKQISDILISLEKI